MKSSLLKSMSLVAFLAVTSPAFADDPVVAIVDGQKITYSQVMESKASLPKQYQSVPEDKIFPVLLNQAVDTLLINKAAQASGEAQKPDVKKSIEKATEEIISQSYLFAKVKDVITDAAVKAKYDELMKNFPKEKEVHLRHILVDSEATAKSVIKALKGGSDFKKLAASKSKDATAKEGGDLGYFRKSELPQELADAAFALTPGSSSETPVKTDFGWHVLKVDDVRDAKPPKFEEVQNELKSLLTQEAIVALLKDLRSHSKVELFGKDGKPLPAKAEKSAPPATPAPAAPASAPAAAPAAAPTPAAPAAPAPAAKK
ncbi:MAG: peptidyl-prolyl cis-trans isomerase [Proteobacteria bacterium]|nr:peptidyl-prolyl cis-trans isomerase [Pseudomonadota bacterium]